MIDPTGVNRLRQSKIDIGIYDFEYNLHLLSDVVVTDKVNLTVVDLAK